MQREGLDLSQFGDLDSILLSRDFDDSQAEEKKVDSIDERSHRSEDPPPPGPMGIGALAAAATVKKRSAQTDEPAPPPGPMGIGALAAAAALKKQAKDGGVKEDSSTDGAVKEPAIKDDPRFSKVRSSFGVSFDFVLFSHKYTCSVLSHAQDGEYSSHGIFVFFPLFHLTTFLRVFQWEL